MAENVRKRCRKSKLETHNVRKEKPTAPKSSPGAPPRQPVHTTSKVYIPVPTKMEFNINVEVEECSEDTKDWGVANVVVPQTTLNLNLEVIEYTTNRWLILKAAKDLMRIAHPAQRFLAVQAKNYAGRFVNPLAKSLEVRLVQKALGVWNDWTALNSDVREAPLLHKCYICGISWWHLNDFKDHISKHVKLTKFKLIVEVEKDTSHLVCVKQDAIRANVVGLETNCYRCGKSADYHNTRKGIFSCEGCDAKMPTCTLLALHEGTCPQYKSQCLPLLEAYSHGEVYKCFVCLMAFYNKYELDNHKSRSHTVRSDLVVPWSVQQCLSCHSSYVVSSLHTCPKKMNNYGCTACGASFQKKVFKEIHFKSCRNDFTCNVCFQRFKRECCKPMHMLQHSERFILLYKCVECTAGRYFPNEYSISHHTQEVHNRAYERKFKYIEMVILPKLCLRDTINNIPDIPLSPTVVPQMEVVKPVAVPPPVSKPVLSEEIMIKQEIDDHEPVDVMQVKAEPLDELDDYNIHPEAAHGVTIKTEVMDDNAELTMDDDGASPELGDTAGAVPEGPPTGCPDGNRTDIKAFGEVTERDNDSPSFAVNIKTEANEDGEIGTDNSMISVSQFGFHIQIKQESEDQQPRIYVTNVSDVQIKEEKEDMLSEILEASGLNSSTGRPVKSQHDSNSSDEDTYESDLIILEKEPDPAVVLSDDEETTSEHDDEDDKDYNVDDEEDDGDDDDADGGGGSGDDNQNADLESTNYNAERRKTRPRKCRYCQFRGPLASYTKHIAQCEGAQAKRVERKKKPLLMRVDTGDVFTCSACDIQAPSVREYAKHLFDVHGYEKYACPQCFTVFKNIDKLVPHIRIHINKMYLKVRVLEQTLTRSKANGCRICNKVVDPEDFFSHWESHMKVKDMGTADEAKEEPLDRQVSPVDNSLSVQKALGVLMSSGVEVHKQCVLCFRSFSRQYDTKRHLIEHLLDEALARHAELRALRCQICWEKFLKPDMYKFHMRSHASMPIYRCALCSKTFSDSSNFAKHKKVHNLAGLKCDICGKKFHIQLFLTKHMEMHQHTKPLVCVVCNKVFYSDSAYKKHLRQSHMRHLMQFKCRSCKIQFNRLRDKWEHQWQVHKERKMPADCPVCDESFRRYLDVKVHVREAHDMDFLTFDDHPLLKLRRKKRDLQLAAAREGGGGKDS